MYWHVMSTWCKISTSWCTTIWKKKCVLNVISLAPSNISFEDIWYEKAKVLAIGVHRSCTSAKNMQFLYAPACTVDLQLCCTCRFVHLGKIRIVHVWHIKNAYVTSSISCYKIETWIGLFRCQVRSCGAVHPNTLLHICKASPKHESTLFLSLSSSFWYLRNFLPPNVLLWIS